MTIEGFSQCILTPVSSADGSNIELGADETWKTSSFFVDSSGRATVSLPMQLQFLSPQVLERISKTGCFDTFLDKRESSAATIPPEDDTTGDGASSDAVSPPGPQASFGIEAKVTLTFGTGEAITAAVEDVVIRSARVMEDDVTMRFETEISVRVSRPDGGRFHAPLSSSVKTNLEVGAVLEEKVTAQSAKSMAAASLEAFSLGGFSTLRKLADHQTALQTRVQPFALLVVLRHALAIEVCSVPSQVMGQTLVSLTVRHSEMHSEPVTITGIALHPGHSAEQIGNETSKDKGYHLVVADMSKVVTWQYAAQCDPHLPLLLAPSEAVSTILVIDASEDKRVRTFSCPVSVTARTGNCTIVAAADVKWTTAKAAIESTDGFRLDLSVGEEAGVVFSPLTVNINVANLSSESRDVMILVESGGDSDREERAKKLKNAAVSEKNGQKFGVWGLADDGNSLQLPPDSDRELLTVDVALVVGELKGNSSKNAELRFIPLKEGTISIPNLKIVDRRRGKWYKAVHNFKLVVRAAD